MLDSASILTTAGTRLLSVDIFSYAGGGMMEGAVALSLLQTAVIITGYVAARLLLGRSPAEVRMNQAVTQSAYALWHGPIQSHNGSGCGLADAYGVSPREASRFAKQAAKMFVGADCGLCRDKNWHLFKKILD
jgi:hypothetical protein